MDGYPSVARPTVTTRYHQTVPAGEGSPMARDACPATAMPLPEAGNSPLLSTIMNLLPSVNRYQPISYLRSAARRTHRIARTSRRWAKASRRVWCRCRTEAGVLGCRLVARSTERRPGQTGPSRGWLESHARAGKGPRPAALRTAAGPGLFGRLAITWRDPPAPRLPGRATDALPGTGVSSRCPVRGACQSCQPDPARDHR